jgi:hypothetical protein
VRDSAPPLLTPFLLRAVPGLIALAWVNMLAVWGTRLARWGVRGLALLIGIGLLPPFDFFRGESADPNYQQQFLISVLTCVGVLIGWSAPRSALAWGAMGLSALCGIAGMYLSLRQYQALNLNAGIGVGATITIGALIVAMVLSLIQTRRPLANAGQGADAPST